MELKVSITDFSSHSLFYTCIQVANNGIQAIFVLTSKYPMKDGQQSNNFVYGKI